MKGKVILWIAMLISLVGHLAWQPIIDHCGVHVWHPLNALFIALLAFVLYLNFKESFICFMLMCFSFNNLADELLFDPAVMGLNEILMAIMTPISWIYVKKKIRNVRT